MVQSQEEEAAKPFESFYQENLRTCFLIFLHSRLAAVGETYCSGYDQRIPYPWFR